jgi:DNA-binding transcriptional MerR regulator
MTPRNVYYLPRVAMSDACRRFGLTARALRFYEERGLVEAHRDRRNYRYYDAVACGRLEWIARLRRGGLSLIEIEQVLLAEEHGGDGREPALQMIERRREALRLELATADELMTEVASLSAAGTFERLGHAR